MAHSHIRFSMIIELAPPPPELTSFIKEWLLQKSRGKVPRKPNPCASLREEENPDARCVSKMREGVREGAREDVSEGVHECVREGARAAGGAGLIWRLFVDTIADSSEPVLSFVCLQHVDQ